MKKESFFRQITGIVFSAMMVLFLAQQPIISVEAAGKTEDVYVLAECNYQWSGGTTLTKYYYTKEGFIKNIKSVGTGKTPTAGNNIEWKYSYDRNMRITSIRYKDKGFPLSNNIGKYMYKNGKLVKQVSLGKTGNTSENYSYKMITTYEYEGDRVVKGDAEIIYKEISDKGKCTDSYSYDKSGHIKQKEREVNGLIEEGKVEWSITYDKKGNEKTYNQIIRTKNGKKITSFASKYNNTYQKGLLIKRTSDNGNQLEYKYKKLSVPKKYAKRVRSQQWALLNDGLQEIAFY